MPARRTRPTSARSDGTIAFALTDCSLGRLLVARSAAGVAAVLLGDDDAALRADLRARVPRESIVEDEERVAPLAARVAAAIDAPTEPWTEPLDARGTEFQRRVWDALRAIAPGTTATYAELARALGLPTHARAVAQACAANPIAVLVPCHRVVRGDRGLAGYRWGIERKRALLAREAAR